MWLLDCQDTAQNIVEISSSTTRKGAKTDSFIRRPLSYRPHHPHRLRRLYLTTKMNRLVAHSHRPDCLRRLFSSFLKAIAAQWLVFLVESPDARAAVDAQCWDPSDVCIFPLLQGPTVIIMEERKKERKKEKIAKNIPSFP
jgi:hypothetical protein